MELVRSFSNISFFYRFSIVFYRNRTRTFKNYYSKYERRYWKPIDFPAKNEYYSRAVSSSAKLSPIWQTRSIPVVTTDVHRSTNRRNKIPNYPWKKHDKIVRNWHPSSHLHTRPPILHSLHRPVSNQCLTSQRFFPLLYSFFFPSREIKQCLTVKTRGKMRLEGFDIATEIFVS